MNDFLQGLDGLLTWLLLPTTLFGAGGAIVHAIRKGRNLKQVVFEGGGGVIIVNALGPVITKNAPEQWHYTLYFLVGWGGLEAFGRLYKTALAGAEKRLQDNLGVKPKEKLHEPWDGVERRKNPR